MSRFCCENLESSACRSAAHENPHIPARGVTGRKFISAQGRSMLEDAHHRRDSVGGDEGQNRTARKKSGVASSIGRVREAAPEDPAVSDHRRTSHGDQRRRASRDHRRTSRDTTAGHGGAKSCRIWDQAGTPAPVTARWCAGRANADSGSCRIVRNVRDGQRPLLAFCEPIAARARPIAPRGNPSHRG